MVFESEEEFALRCGAIVERISRAMAEKGRTAAVAESLTGGLISSEIVRVPGVSAWFTEGIVTYTDAAKTRRLDVSEELLAEHTAVSAEAAKAMAEGALRFSGAGAAVSATGIAGPGPDELGREAGLVFIGGATERGCVSRELKLSGGRLDIRRSAAYEALKLLLALAEGL